MKHAGKACLDSLEPLLVRLRAILALKEKGRGVFYVKSKAWLHFHEDPAGTFADVWNSRQWQRFQVDSKTQQATMLAALKKSLRAPVQTG